MPSDRVSGSLRTGRNLTKSLALSVETNSTVEDVWELKLADRLLRARLAWTVLPEIVKCKRHRYYGRLEHTEREIEYCV